MTERPTEAQHVACQMPTDEEYNSGGAPERIWASPDANGDWLHGFCSDALSDDSGAEYIRADLATPFVTSALSTSVPVTSDAGPVEAGPAVSELVAENERLRLALAQAAVPLEGLTLAAAYSENNLGLCKGTWDEINNGVSHIRAVLATSPASDRTSSPDHPDAAPAGGVSASPAFSDMSLRDWFAGQVLSGPDSGGTPKSAASWAYQVAGEMIAARAALGGTQ